MIPTKQIRLEKWASTKDAAGNFKESIQQAFNLWASVKKQNNNIIKDRVSLSDTMGFMVRFRPDFKLTGEWFIVYLGKRFSIQNIERINEKRFNWLIIGKS